MIVTIILLTIDLYLLHTIVIILMIIIDIR